MDACMRFSGWGTRANVLECRTRREVRDPAPSRAWSTHPLPREKGCSVLKKDRKARRRSAPIRRTALRGFLNPKSYSKFPDRIQSLFTDAPVSPIDRPGREKSSHADRRNRNLQPAGGDASNVHKKRTMASLPSGARALPNPRWRLPTPPRQRRWTSWSTSTRRGHRTTPCSRRAKDSWPRGSRRVRERAPLSVSRDPERLFFSCASGGWPRARGDSARGSSGRRAWDSDAATTATSRDFGRPAWNTPASSADVSRPHPQNDTTKKPIDDVCKPRKSPSAIRGATLCGRAASTSSLGTCPPCARSRLARNTNPGRGS